MNCELGVDYGSIAPVPWFELFRSLAQTFIESLTGLYLHAPSVPGFFVRFIIGADFRPNVGLVGVCTCCSELGA